MGVGIVIAAGKEEEKCFCPPGHEWFIGRQLSRCQRLSAIS